MSTYIQEWKSCYIYCTFPVPTFEIILEKGTCFLFDHKYDDIGGQKSFLYSLCFVGFGKTLLNKTRFLLYHSGNHEFQLMMQKLKNKNTNRGLQEKSEECFKFVVLSW